LGEVIRVARKEAGFSQEKMAEKADLSTVFITWVTRAADGTMIGRGSNQLFRLLK